MYLHFLANITELLGELRAVPENSIYQEDLARILGVVARHLRTDSVEVFEDMKDAIESLSIDPVHRLMAFSHLLNRPGLSGEYRDSTFQRFSEIIQQIAASPDQMSRHPELEYVRDFLRRNRSLNPQHRQQLLSRLLLIFYVKRG